MKFVETFISIISLWALTIFNEYFAGLLSTKLNISDNLIFLLAAILISLFLFWFLYKRKKIAVDIVVDVLKDEHQKSENAHKGLVLILSAFNPSRGSKLEKFKLEQPVEYEKALREMNIDTLMLDDVSQSNFGHSVTALKAHEDRLEHVWLICTMSNSERTSQSVKFAPLLEKYVEEKISPLIKVHFGIEYAIVLDEDASVCRNSFKIIKKIYKQANKLGLKTKDMITDVTGGIKSLNTGAILACLNKDENIQMIGTTYDEDGKFKGKAFPMIIEYKPSLIEAD